MENRFKEIPSVDSLLEDPLFMRKMRGFSKKLIKESIRESAKLWRNKLKENTQQEFSRKDFIKDIKALAKEKNQKSVRRVINAQGVILSTNLGRAILPQDAIDSVLDVLGGYSNLELNLKTGMRGSRYFHLRELLKKLTGTEEALIVNNNAGAVFLSLNTLADGKEVIVSRGELIEIGGSFRLPDVLSKSGAKLVEVGTTNKTYIRDYESAISEKTGLLLKSHTSNYKILGFTETPSTQDLVELGEKKGIPIMEDLGSGLFIDMRRHGIPYEPTVQDVLGTGVDIVTFSGDKLMGGPQAGIILGKKKYIELIESNPLLRTLRVGKMVIAAMEALLRIYIYREIPIRKLLSLGMIIKSPESIKEDAEKIVRKIKPYFNGEVEIIKGYSEIGGGSFPGVKLDTWLISLKPSNVRVQELAESLRMNTPPIIPRTKEDKIFLDPRTIQKDEIEDIIDFFKTYGSN